MAIETEIKLALPAGQADAARRFFATLTGEDGDVITLANVYYDTPDLALARSKSAVRVRRTPHGWLQTFKTVGSAQDGLHSRHEWELPVAGDALEIDALVAACDVPDAAAALRDAAPALHALFRTDFSRTLWRIAIGGATVEAAVDVGEIVVTSLDPHHPWIRLALGDLTAALPGASPCGRTNMRIKGWMGRADQTTKVKGMFVRPEQVAEIGKRHPELGRLRLVVTRSGESDLMTLKAETAAPGETLQSDLAASLRAVTKLGGNVELVAAGSLPNDGKVIADERG